MAKIHLHAQRFQRFTPLNQVQELLAHLWAEVSIR